MRNHDLTPLVSNVVEEKNYARFFKGPYKEGDPTPETYISVQAKDNPDKLSLKDWVAVNREGITHKNVSVAGSLAIQEDFENLNLGTTGSKVVFVAGGKYIYQISLILMGDNREEVRQIFDLMLSTFRFLEPEEGE